MSSDPSLDKSLTQTGSNTSLDDAEKGLVDSTPQLPVFPSSAVTSEKRIVNLPLLPSSPIHEGLTPQTDSPPALASPASLEKQVQPTISEKPKTPRAAPARASRWIRFVLWYNCYRRFFTFCVTLNGIGIVLAAADKFDYAKNNLGALVLGNLLMAILMRNEIFGRCLYWLAIHGLRGWAPLWIRLGVTSILQHLGGIHSGCALSGSAWLVYKVVDIFRHHSLNHNAVLITGVITNLFVVISILSAFPWVRNTHHNVFERHHRFIGWLGLAATWIFVVLGNTYDLKTQTWRTDGDTLIAAQEFWFCLGMTVFILTPWFTVREVSVDIEIPSPKVAVVRFKRGMQQGLLGRISRSSIMEYHAFGIISEGVDSRYHYMICGVQGDFTKSLVQNPPRTLWTRELKFAGVGHASAMYKRGIRVCTGTGLGAALSTCIQSPNWFLIWIGSDQEKTFGPTITGLIKKHIEPERMILWDSKKRGARPNTMELLKDVYKRWNAEVIFITSNFQGNTEMMEGCREAGMNAFGTLWDF